MSIKVPWHNAACFKKVYEYLYSDDLNKKKWACDTLAVWEANCHPTLPTAVEATYVLTCAVIQDILWINKASLLHHTDLQGLYGLAIIRFVSLTVEANKDMDVPSYSIAQVAKKVGIPSFIVHLRNELCHSGRPTLPMLRQATEAALEHLKKVYWEKEAVRVCNDIRQPSDETQLRNLFQKFIQLHSDANSSKKDKAMQSDDENRRRDVEYCRTVIKLEKYLRRNKLLFVKVLVSEGIFIPTDEDLKNMVDKEKYILFDHEYYLDDDDESEGELNGYDDPYGFEAKNIPEIPDRHESLWVEVISLLNKYDSVSLFMELLLESQGNRTIAGQKLLISWILNFLRLHSSCGFAANIRSLKKVFRKKGFVINWFRLLHSALVNPCKYNVVLLPIILQNIDLSGVKADRIIGLISIKLGLANAGELKEKYSKLFYTVDDLKEVLKNQKNNEEELSECLFSPCPDTCHKSWPIGSIVNIVREYNEEEQMECVLESDSENNASIESNKNEDEEEGDDDKDNDLETHMIKVRMEVKNKRSLLGI